MPSSAQVTRNEFYRTCATGVKKTKKKGEEDEKEDPMSGRRKLTMDDLAAAEKGVALVRCGNIRVRKLKN